MISVISWTKETKFDDVVHFVAHRYMGFKLKTQESRAAWVEASLKEGSLDVGKDAGVVWHTIKQRFPSLIFEYLKGKIYYGGHK